MDYAAVARFALRWPRALGAGLLVLVLVAAALGLPPKVEGDLVRLLPPDDPAAVAVASLQGQPGGEGVAAVILAPGTDPAPIVDALEARPTVRATFYGLEDADPVARKLGLLQLDPAEVRSIAGRIDGAMRFPNPLIQARLLDIGDALQPEALDLLPDDTIFVIPTASSLDPDYCVELLEDLEAAAPDAIWFAGAHVTVATTVREVKSDLVRTSGFSLLGVILVMSLAFRDPRAVLLLFPPLLLAVVVTLAGIQIVAGSLNTYTSLGGAALFGLGIDFGVHLVARYRENRGLGLAPPDAVEQAWAGTGPPCATAALTSAAGFAALALADFRGISQLGFSLAAGVLICLCFTLLLLPGLLVWLDPKPRSGAAPLAGPEPRLGRVFALGLALTAALSLTLPDIPVEYDLGALRGEGQAWSELDDDQRAWRQSAYPPVVVRVESATPAARIAERDRLRALVEAGDLPHIRGVASVDDLLPPDQDARWAELEALIALAGDPRLRTLPPPVVEALSPLAGLDPTPLAESDLPAGLAPLVGAGRPWVLMFPQGNLQDLRESAEMAAEFEAAQPMDAASPFLAQASMFTLVNRDLPRIALAALLAVAGLAALDLRNLRLAGVAVGGLVAGLGWAGAGLAAFGVPISFANVVALPILLGIGVDVVVHLLHRLQAERRSTGGGGIAAALRTTGVASGISAATSIVAFAALVAAENRGVRSIGQAVVIGLSAIFVAAILLVPAAWQTLTEPKPAPTDG